MQDRELTAIRVTRNPENACWQLPLQSLEGSDVCLVGWVLRSAPVDSGMPEEAGSVLLRAVLDHWNVTFFDEEFGPTTTSELSSALRLFEGVRYAWDQMNQIGFLSPLDQPPPRIREEHRLRLRSEAGVTGVILPAVDGDFAAFAFFDRSMPVFLTSLEQTCLSRGVEFELVSEQQFKSAAWYASALAPGSGK